jgi:hypothetical protein
MKTLKSLFAAAILVVDVSFICKDALAAENPEFIFSGQGVTSSRDPAQFIRVGETL